MRIKPKILASNPRSISMPATGLHQREKRGMNIYNEAKYDIMLPVLRLRCIILASFYTMMRHNRLGRLAETTMISPYSCWVGRDYKMIIKKGSTDKLTPIIKWALDYFAA
jgi:hypothetical protein